MICSSSTECLDLVSGKVAKFCLTNDISHLPCGHHDIGGGDYLNIENYTTNDREQSKYESHLDYADIQMVLDGEEIIEVHPIDNLTVIEPYDEKRDIAFYSNKTRGASHLMRPGSFMYLAPEDGHMPRISFDSRVTVRKAIFKIRLSQNLQRIRFLVMDVDGTLTDGQVFIGANGEIFKNFNIKDGLGIADILPALNITPIIITGRKSEMLAQRCKELKIEELHQGVSDKLSVLNRIVDVAGERLSSVCYVGDDINDLACMKEVKRKGGYVACPQDAAKQIKSIAHCALTSPGGKGAVRELIDILVANRRS